MDLGLLSTHLHTDFKEFLLNSTLCQWQETRLSTCKIWMISIFSYVSKIEMLIWKNHKIYKIHTYTSVFKEITHSAQQTKTDLHSRQQVVSVFVILEPISMISFSGQMNRDLPFRSHSEFHKSFCAKECWNESRVMQLSLTHWSFLWLPISTAYIPLPAPRVLFPGIVSFPMNKGTR